MWRNETNELTFTVCVSSFLHFLLQRFDPSASLSRALDKDVMLWNVLILGYMKFGCTSEVQGLLVKAEQGGVRGFVCVTTQKSRVVIAPMFPTNR